MQNKTSAYALRIGGLLLMFENSFKILEGYMYVKIVA